jgi:hypothetical protein
MSTADGSLQRLSSEELRAAVRAVLRDVLPAGLTDADGTTAAAAPRAAMAGEVVVQTDADLGALVRQVALLCEDPAARAALREGRHGFLLARTGSSHPPHQGPAASFVRIERGAVTERAVARAAAEGARLVLGPKAVLTPLARDKARVLGVEIEKER